METSPNHWGSLLIDQLLVSATTHQLILLLNKPDATLEALKSDRVLPVLCGKPATHAAARAWWYDYTLPAVLKKHKVELLLGIYGYISLCTKIPQWLFLHDVQEPIIPDSLAGWSTLWYRQRLGNMVQKATHLFADYPAKMNDIPAFSKPDILKKILEIGRFSVPGPLSLSQEQLDNTKQRLADGKEYFLCIEGWQHQKAGLDLLLSFSAFKKRMQSGMKLLLVGQPQNKKVWAEKMRTYRYRNDVVMLVELPHELPIGSVISAAYALLHLPLLPKTNYLLYAMQAGTPVIVNHHPVWQQVAGNSVLYYQQDEPKAQIATWLMLLYKDENRRRELLEEAKKITLQNTAVPLAEKLLLYIADMV